MLRKVLMVGVYAAALSAAVPRVILADEPEASDALEEITVTAEKSTQNLQKTAAAVTVVSADQLINNGITDLRQAQQLVPSVRFQAEGNNTQVFIRGVGSNLDEGNVEPSVAFNIAGIYVPREATSAGFFDLEQLEVLPGPQGTLYGRSAIGGTVNVTPTRPGFDSEGSSLLEVGNYAAVHGTVTQDFKASDTIAFRAAIDYSKNQGFETTGADSKNDVSGRLSTLIKPNDLLSVYLWTQAAGEYGYAMNAVNKGTDPNTGAYCEQCFLSSNPWNDTRTGALAGPFGIPTKEANHYTSAIVGGQIDYRFDGVTLSYLPSYLYLDTHPSYWLSAILTSNSADYNQITQELRLASTGVGPLQWLGGLYFYHQRNSSENYLYVPVPVLQDSVPYDRLQGYAAFGQATYSFTDTFRATVGGRASKTERTAHGDEPLGLGGLPYSFDRTFNHIDWKAALEHVKTLHVEPGKQPALIRDLAFEAVDGPVTHVEPAPDEVFRVGHEPPVEAERPADVVNDDAALGQFLGHGEAADGVGVHRADGVVRGRDIDRGFVFKTFEMPAGLREIDFIDPRAGALLGGQERAVRGLAGGLEVHHGALDDAARGGFPYADDAEFAAAGDLAHEHGDFGGADFNGADDLGVRNHVERYGLMRTKGRGRCQVRAHGRRFASAPPCRWSRGPAGHWQG